MLTKPLSHPTQVSEADASLTCHLCGRPYDRAATRPLRVVHGQLTLAAVCHCCGSGRLLRMGVPSHWHLADLSVAEVWQLLRDEASSVLLLDMARDEWEALLE
ncbi:MAG: hypothetical protein ACK4WM_05790 [Thermoflexales bacterium]